MTLSQLIAKLEAVRAEHGGDLEVLAMSGMETCTGYDRINEPEVCGVAPDTYFAFQVDPGSSKKAVLL